MAGTAADAQARRLRVGEYDVGLRSSGSRGPNVVLIHGIGASARYFERLAAVLSAVCRVHCVELPGHAGLPRPPRPLPMHGYADVVVQALRQAGIDSVHVVGHSMGCQVAVETAILAPETISSLLLLGPTVNQAEHHAALQGLRLAQDTLREKPAVNGILLTDYLRAGPPWYLSTLRRMMKHRLEDRLAQVSCPVAVVRGARDPIAPSAWLLRLQESRAGTRSGEVPGAAHVLMWDRPAETAAWVYRMVEAGK